ncbi:helix-turn-helix transcriptional regulator [Caryophanon tenue]|nr:helix-turn-helix domain-containing protein [Caryophanon tenue]
MFNIYVHCQQPEYMQQMKEWIAELALPNITFTHSLDEASLYITQIDHLYDWITLRRIQRAYPQCIIIPIVPSKLAYSASIAVELQLAYLLIEPLQKHKFLRAARKIYTTFQQQKQQSTFDYEDLSVEMQEAGSLYYDTLLRSIIRKEIQTEQQLLQATAPISMKKFPNTVLFLQCFATGTPTPLQHCEHVYTLLKAAFAQDELHCLPFGNRLVVLIHVPNPYQSFLEWTTGIDALTQVIDTLKTAHIYTYMGIGTTVGKPLDLYHSYIQARMARRKPPANWIHMRFAEQLPKHPSILQAVDYIEKHCHEPLNISQVARVVGFSPAYFGKLFKRETGLNFPEYTAYIRIIHTLIPLRRTTQTLEQISADYGFNTSSYFSGIFKKYVTLSPSDYRHTREIFFK